MSIASKLNVCRYASVTAASTGAGVFEGEVDEAGEECEAGEAGDEGEGGGKEIQEENTPKHATGKLSKMTDVGHTQGYTTEKQLGELREGEDEVQVEEEVEEERANFEEAAKLGRDLIRGFIPTPTVTVKSESKLTVEPEHSVEETELQKEYAREYTTGTQFSKGEDNEARYTQGYTTGKQSEEETQVEEDEEDEKDGEGKADLTVHTQSGADAVAAILSPHIFTAEGVPGRESHAARGRIMRFGNYTAVRRENNATAAAGDSGVNVPEPRSRRPKESKRWNY